MDPTDEAIIEEVRRGNTERFEELVRRYSPRLFALVRRHARREDEVADIVQEIFLKAFQKLDGFRGDAPFEHWLMRLSVRLCYDFLRSHQRNREDTEADLSDEMMAHVERWGAAAEESGEDRAQAARALVHRLLDQMAPAQRLVLTLLELEDRSVREISDLTGWSVPLVKVRAFRARAEMRRLMKRMDPDKFL